MRRFRRAAACCGDDENDEEEADEEEEEDDDEEEEDDDDDDGDNINPLLDPSDSTTKSTRLAWNRIFSSLRSVCTQRQSWCKKLRPAISCEAMDRTVALSNGVYRWAREKSYSEGPRCSSTMQ